MSKKKHSSSASNLGYFAKYLSEPWFLAGFVVITIVTLHTIVFSIHSFTVFRYESLYEQIRSNGSTIQMPEDFLHVEKRSQDRSFLTRPDILAEEIGIIHSGTRAMIYQYQNDVYRLHDAIVQHIKYVLLASEIGQELIFPGQERLSEQATIIQSRLDVIVPGDVHALVELSELSTNVVETTQRNIAYAQKKLVYQDILAFKHEMLLLADMYRLNPAAKSLLDIKQFWNQFRTIFSREGLTNSSHEILRTSLDQLKSSTDEYRSIAAEMRKKDGARRASWMETELEKWEKRAMQAPTSPLPDVYELIYISLSAQMMYVYEDNELILSTPITSGRNNYETIRGKFRIYTKQRGKTMKSPFPEEEYELWVDYWMGFSGAYGIHDACNSTDCWRTKFGGASYVYNGSHGCINTPYNAVKFIYNWAKVGTTVYVR